MFYYFTAAPLLAKMAELGHPTECSLSKILWKVLRLFDKIAVVHLLMRNYPLQLLQQHI